MGTTKTQTQTSGTQTATATPEEKQLEQLQLGQAQAADPYARSMQQAGGQLATNLLQGNNQALPQMYQNMMGIDPNAIASQATELTRQALPQFQAQGLLTSGTMDQNIQSMIANQLAYPTAQYNIGAKQNLLNLALGGQASIQAPMQNNTNMLGTQLAGLRTVNSQSSSMQNTQNPFLTSFIQGLGGLGQAAGGVGGFMTGWGNRNG